MSDRQPTEKREKVHSNLGWSRPKKYNQQFRNKQNTCTIYTDINTARTRRARPACSWGTSSTHRSTAAASRLPPSPPAEVEPAEAVAVGPSLSGSPRAFGAGATGFGSVENSATAPLIRSKLSRELSHWLLCPVRNADTATFDP